jgi:deoxyadenosine/deoxycytidine kinase
VELAFKTGDISDVSLLREIIGIGRLKDVGVDPFNNFQVSNYYKRLIEGYKNLYSNYDMLPDLEKNEATVTFSKDEDILAA